MPCIMTLMALATPRLVVALLWFFTHWFRGVFDNALVFRRSQLVWRTLDVLADRRARHRSHDRPWSGKRSTHPEQALIISTRGWK